MRKNNRMKLAGLLLCGGMILQFGGCLGPFFQQAGIGFSRAFGAVPAAFVTDYLFGFFNLDGTTE